MDQETPQKIIDTEHLKWAIEQRGKIQYTLLALYERVKTLQVAPADFKTDEMVENLIAAAFCLWRAVFLADRPRSAASIRVASVS
jgi:hypothetical protein